MSTVFALLLMVGTACIMTALLGSITYRDREDTRSACLYMATFGGVLSFISVLMLYTLS